ncbi:VrrA/YqfQ family protein [Bacillus sp. Hm123]|uniref:VrrA/YqfQ family protein n=1 Tax=Bacillus sp. Hm123 TaxID=3450745 RepID=UPI003F43DF26
MGGRGGQGLLGRLLNRQGQSGIPFTGFERQGGTRAGASTAQQLANPMNLQQMLSNTQQVLQTVQQVGPIIEQYGPFVKNLPAMWKLYRGLKSLPDATSENVEAAKDAHQKESKNKEVITPKDEKIQASEQLKDSASTPKLYI